jgi:nicotinamide riboside kinase
MKQLTKIILTGPESVGKSTLTMQLSKSYRAPFISEIARKYIENLNRPYELEDVLNIAKLQIKEEKHYSNQKGLLFIDTDLIITKIWLKRVYNFVPDWIDKHLISQPASLHLLCYPDLPWVYDPVRENPESRLELFNEYKTEIEKLDIPYSIILGENEERFNNALKSVIKYSGIIPI